MEILATNSVVGNHQSFNFHVLIINSLIYLLHISM